MYEMNLHVYFARRHLVFPIIRAYFSVFLGSLQVGVLPDIIGAQLGSGRAIEMGHFMVFIPVVASQFFVALEVCLGLLSC